MPRRARWLQDTTATLNAPYVLVDAGDSLAEPVKSQGASAFLQLLSRKGGVQNTPSQPVPLSEAEQEAKRHVARLYKELGYNALGIGAYDLRYLPVFQGASNDLPVFLSANGFKDGKPAFAPYVLQDFGGAKVAITSVLSRTKTPKDEAVSIDIREPVAILKETLSGLRKEADLVIVLANMPLDEAKQVAYELSGIDLMVLSGENAITRESFDVNGTKIVGSDDKGRSIGKVIFSRDKLHNKYSVANFQLVLLERTMPEDERFLKLINAMP